MDIDLSTLNAEQLDALIAAAAKRRAEIFAYRITGTLR